MEKRSLIALTLMMPLLFIVIMAGYVGLYSIPFITHANNASKINTSVGDPYCTNQASSNCDSIEVSAQITGSNDLDSYGVGTATGDALLGGACCVADSYALVQIGYYVISLGIYNHTTLVLWLDGSTVSASYHPAGNIMYTSVVQNMCGSVEPSVAASLAGTCFT